LQPWRTAPGSRGSPAPGALPLEQREPCPWRTAPGSRGSPAHGHPWRGQPWRREPCPRHPWRGQPGGGSRRQIQAADGAEMGKIRPGGGGWRTARRRTALRWGRSALAAADGALPLAANRVGRAPLAANRKLPDLLAADRGRGQRWRTGCWPRLAAQRRRDDAQKSGSGPDLD
jgi:hypothetical protein